MIVYLTACAELRELTEKIEDVGDDLVDEGDEDSPPDETSPDDEGTGDSTTPDTTPGDPTVPDPGADPWPDEAAGTWEDAGELRLLDVGDVDVDARHDVLALVEDGSSYGAAVVLWGDDLAGGARWSHTQVDAPAFVTTAFLADVDGEGHDDLVFDTTASTIVVVSGERIFDGTAASTDPLLTFGTFDSVEPLADLTGDGGRELVAVEADLAWIFADVAATTELVTADAALVALQLDTEDFAPRDVGDADGDGIGDILFTADETVALVSGADAVALEGLSVGIADAGDALGTLPIGTNGLAPRRLGDVDGDGLADLAAEFDADASHRHTSVWFGSGASGPLLLARSATPLGDLDGDGKGDLALADRSFAIYLLAGSGIAGSSVDVAAEAWDSRPGQALRSGDLDGDGALDLVLEEAALLSAYITP
ncbi:MAG: hypothetical protein ACOZNI_26180 [Myxococcota bacterium]